MVTWADDVKQVLEELGCEARLSQIYPRVQAIRRDRGAPLGDYKAWVRNVLQINSRGRGRDLFHPIQLGSGWWRLKQQ